MTLLTPTDTPLPRAKPLDPGQRVSWHSEQHGPRTGLVWSAGPAGARTLWVVPALPLPGEAPAVLLNVRQARGQTATLTERSGQDDRQSTKTYQDLLAAAYRQAWAEPTGSHPWDSHGMPGSIHRRAQQLADAAWRPAAQEDPAQAA